MSTKTTNLGLTVPVGQERLSREQEQRNAKLIDEHDHDAGAGRGVAINQFVPLTTPLTSASWDGDSYSTTGATLIDLSVVFGVPAGVKAVLVELLVRDSGSAAGDTRITLGPSATYYYALQGRCSGLANDAYGSAQGIVPCNADGDIYYDIIASGAGTLDVTMRIWGYWI